MRVGVRVRVRGDQSGSLTAHKGCPHAAAERGEERRIGGVRDGGSEGGRTEGGREGEREGRRRQRDAIGTQRTFTDSSTGSGPPPSTISQRHCSCYRPCHRPCFNPPHDHPHIKGPQIKSEWVPSRPFIIDLQATRLTVKASRPPRSTDCHGW